MCFRLLLSLPLLALAATLTSCDPQSGGMIPEGGAGELLVRPGMSDETEVVLLARDLRVAFDLAQSQVLQTLVSREPGYALVVEDAQGEVAVQSKQFRAAITRAPRVIFLDALDAALLDPILSEATREGVTVISLNEQVVPPRCASAVYCPEAEVGRIAGRMIVEALDRKAGEEGAAEATGRLVEIRGVEGDPRCEARHQGMMEELAKRPGIVLVHDAPGGWVRESCEAVLADAYRLQHEFDVVYAHDDSMAAFAGQAAVDQGVRVDTFILGTNGFGGADGGQDLMRRGDIDATIFHPIPADFAWRIVKKWTDDPSFQAKPKYQLQPAPITHWNLDKVRQGGLPPYPSL